MFELTANIPIENGQINIILLIGLAVLGGTVGAKIFQRLCIPSIVGYVAIGILFGPLLGIITLQRISSLEPFNMFALGVIGFLIGGELKREIFTKFGRQVIAILLFEGLAAFLLVGLLSFGITCYFFDWKTALAISVIFGAICAATDPASTMNVLWEYKARGPLTTMLTAIVALDDALALVLYAVCVGIAGVITGHQETGFGGALLTAFYEIFGSLTIGVIAGIALNWILKRTDEPDRTLIFCISTALVIIGIAITARLDIIISTMAMGVTLINSGSRKTASSFEIVHKFSAPIYVLFFVLVGARLNISSLSTQVVLLALAYFLGSIVGKTAGSWCGAAYSKTVPAIRKYLGFCLYQQGTIAIALLFMASSKFEGEIRDTMLSVIVACVFVLQLVGPVFVKIATKKAGEAGLNITEEDLIRTYCAGDVMDKKVPVIPAELPLSEVIKIVSSTDSFYYPIVDHKKTLSGAITLDGIRNTFATQELNDWLIAMDIAEPVLAKINHNLSLTDAFYKTKQIGVEYIPVVDDLDDDKLVGVLDTNAAHRKLSAEVLAKQHQADSMYTLGLGKS